MTAPRSPDRAGPDAVAVGGRGRAVEASVRHPPRAGCVVAIRPRPVLDAQPTSVAVHAEPVGARHRPVRRLAAHRLRRRHGLT